MASDGLCAVGPPRVPETLLVCARCLHRSFEPWDREGPAASYDLNGGRHRPWHCAPSLPLPNAPSRMRGHPSCVRLNQFVMQFDSRPALGRHRH
jgi:hypothetical protein